MYLQEKNIDEYPRNRAKLSKKKNNKLIYWYKIITMAYIFLVLLLFGKSDRITKVDSLFTPGIRMGPESVSSNHVWSAYSFTWTYDFAHLKINKLQIKMEMENTYVVDSANIVAVATSYSVYGKHWKWKNTLLKECGHISSRPPPNRFLGWVTWT